jgi:hypothetical protein
MQRMFNVTLGHVLVTIVEVEMQYLLHILSVCVFAALGIQHAMHVLHIVISGLSVYTAICHVIS